ncbi:hypothetical protein AWQ14_06670 [Vibrio parahaemolyticus]|uniref:hypothetical protein n=1 Tax=Vibrio parahaemolyticus TaxID=670 RepID=UPI0007A02C59|nr:hypothetical protein [Vibrio parahaemolyticus]KYY55001.1 hypothetical protein AWQ14_06670 [Vibrio parahaemolyticus]
MALKKDDFLTSVWAFDANGKKVHPYKGERGAKKGLFSVNFTNDTNNFNPMTKEQLEEAIRLGKFKERGTIRMLPLDYKAGDERNAFSPLYFNDIPVKSFG